MKGFLKFLTFLKVLEFLDLPWYVHYTPLQAKQRNLQPWEVTLSGNINVIRKTSKWKRCTFSLSFSLSLSFDILVLDNKWFCFQILQRNAVFSVSLPFSSFGSGCQKPCSVLPFLFRMHTNIGRGFDSLWWKLDINAGKWLPWSSALVGQGSLMALDIEGRMCLQQNQSNLPSQRAQIYRASDVFCCSIQQFAQVFNLVITPSTRQDCQSPINHITSVRALFLNRT